MLYQLLKPFVRIALFLYCRRLKINNKHILNSEGPLLIAANHPDSFLDAVIIATLFRRPVYSLVRGDVYVHSVANRILTALNMLPVYRMSEGAENLGNNYNTFTKCREIFKRNGIVLIFSEGRCINEWHLRPLKKGTARLAISSWEENIPLKVIPAGINYQSFTKFGKNVKLNFGSFITKSDIDLTEGEGRCIAAFNEQLRLQLEHLVIHIDKNNKLKIINVFRVKISIIKKIILALPALLGYAIHLLPYLIIRNTLGKRFRNNDHYDSVMVAGMFITYPLFLLLCAVLLFYFKIKYWWLCFILIPFCGWCYIQIKKQF